MLDARPKHGVILYGPTCKDRLVPAEHISKFHLSHSLIENDLFLSWVHRALMHV